MLLFGDLYNAELKGFFLSDFILFANTRYLCRLHFSQYPCPFSSHVHFIPKSFLFQFYFDRCSKENDLVDANASS